MQNLLAPLQNVELDYSRTLSLRLLHIEKKKNEKKKT